MLLAGLEEVRQWGWDETSLLERLIEFDHLLLGETLTEAREGTVQQWAPYFAQNQDAWVLAAEGPDSIHGYWVFGALTAPEFKRAKAGVLLDSEVTVQNTLPLTVPGLYDMYFILFGVLPGRAHVGACLIRAFFERLARLAARGVRFREIVANAYSVSGERLCRRLGMEFVVAHRDLGSVYSMRLTPWPAVLDRRWPELSCLYAGVETVGCVPAEE